MTNLTQSNFSLVVDSQKQIFCLSAHVFQGSAELPKSIANFFTAINTTPASLVLEKSRAISFREQIPYNLGFQPTLRQRVYQFLRRAQQCRQILERISHIEKLRDINSILDS